MTSPQASRALTLVTAAVVAVAGCSSHGAPTSAAPAPAPLTSLPPAGPQDSVAQKAILAALHVPDGYTTDIGTANSPFNSQRFADEFAAVFKARSSAISDAAVAFYVGRPSREILEIVVVVYAQPLAPQQVGQSVTQAINGAGPIFTFTKSEKVTDVTEVNGHLSTATVPGDSQNVASSVAVYSRPDILVEIVSEGASQAAAADLATMEAQSIPTL